MGPLIHFLIHFVVDRVEQRDCGDTRTVRSSVEIHARLLERLGYVLTRPGMYGNRAFDISKWAEQTMSDLCFIDERDEAWTASKERLKARFPSQYYLWELDHWFGDPFDVPGLYTEAATVMAEEAARLGYYQLPSLSSGDWERLPLDDLDWCASRDWTMSEIDEWLPTPSWGTGHGRRTYIFVPPDANDGWVCFDFTDSYRPGVDPRLRDVRVPSIPARDGVVLTPHGRTLVGPRTRLPSSVLRPLGEPK